MLHHFLVSIFDALQTRRGQKKKVSKSGSHALFCLVCQSFYCPAPLVPCPLSLHPPFLPSLSFSLPVKLGSFSILGYRHPVRGVQLLGSNRLQDDGEALQGAGAGGLVGVP